MTPDTEKAAGGRDAMNQAGPIQGGKHCEQRGKFWCYFCHAIIECSCGWRSRESHEHITEDSDAD